jgi:hypothetical protein
LFGVGWRAGRGSRLTNNTRNRPPCYCDTLVGAGGASFEMQLTQVPARGSAAEAGWCTSWATVAWAAVPPVATFKLDGVDRYHDLLEPLNHVNGWGRGRIDGLMLWRWTKRGPPDGRGRKPGGSEQPLHLTLRRHRRSTPWTLFGLAMICTDASYATCRPPGG